MSGIQWIRGRSQSLCVRCHRDVENESKRLSLCADCASRETRELGQQLRDCRALPIATCGWTNHGKTSFLVALNATLWRMASVWRDYSLRALTEYSHETIQCFNGLVGSGSLPEATTDEGPGCESVLLELKRPNGENQDRLLMFQDVPGAAFDGHAVNADRVPLLRHSSVAFLLISLPDLERRSEGRTHWMLADSVIRSLRAGGADSAERKRLIVVLTKADRIIGLPPSLRRWLIQDRLWDTLSKEEDSTTDQSDDAVLPDSRAYFRQLESTSQRIQEWLESYPDGKQLVRIARDAGISLRFSLVSATGATPGDNNRLAAPWHPRRVIDPFLWALDSQRPTLTLDSSRRRLRLSRSEERSGRNRGRRRR